MAIIENVSGRDLHYGVVPFDMSQFDSRNLVIQVGGFSETLGPQFGGGWMSPTPAGSSPV